MFSNDLNATACTVQSTGISTISNDSYTSINDNPTSIILDENCSIEVLGEKLTAHQFRMMIKIFKKEHPEVNI